MKKIRDLIHVLFRSKYYPINIPAFNKGVHFIHDKCIQTETKQLSKQMILCLFLSSHGTERFMARAAWRLYRVCCMMDSCQASIMKSWLLIIICTLFFIISFCSFLIDMQSVYICNVYFLLFSICFVHFVTMFQNK